MHVMELFYATEITGKRVQPALRPGHWRSPRAHSVGLFRHHEATAASGASRCGQRPCGAGGVEGVEVARPRLLWMALGRDKVWLLLPV